MSQNNQNITFAYWVPNVSGGLVVSQIEQRTDWSYDYNGARPTATSAAATTMIKNTKICPCPSPL